MAHALSLRYRCAARIGMFGGSVAAAAASRRRSSGALGACALALRACGSAPARQHRVRARGPSE
jgi:hypothetical protein